MSLHGNPAKVIGSYDDYVKKNKECMKQRPVYGEEYTLRNKNITKEMKEKMKRDLEDGIGYVE